MGYLPATKEQANSSRETLSLKGLLRIVTLALRPKQAISKVILLVVQLKKKDIYGEF